MDAAMELIWENSYGSTTIDAICDKAKVKKGSFYYFFESKSDLAVEALRTEWETTKKPAMDAMFSPTVAPLMRLKNYFNYVYERQAQIKKESGRVLGCPLFTLGCEISTQDPRICGAVQSILQQYQKYVESTIRDAHGLGLISAPNAAAKAKCLFSYFEGALVQARIQNDVEPLKDLYSTSLEILGARSAVAA